jgi:hypothetical protein
MLQIQATNAAAAITFPLPLVDSSGNSFKKSTANQAAGHQDRVAHDNARPHRVGPVAPFDFATKPDGFSKTAYAAVKKGSDLCIHEYHPPKPLAPFALPRDHRVNRSKRTL